MLTCIELKSILYSSEGEGAKNQEIYLFDIFPGILKNLKEISAYNFYWAIFYRICMVIKAPSDDDE